MRGRVSECSGRIQKGRVCLSGALVNRERLRGLPGSGGGGRPSNGCQAGQQGRGRRGVDVRRRRRLDQCARGLRSLILCLRRPTQPWPQTRLLHPQPSRTTLYPRNRPRVKPTRRQPLPPKLQVPPQTTDLACMHPLGRPMSITSTRFRSLLSESAIQPPPPLRRARPSLIPTTPTLLLQNTLPSEKSNLIKIEQNKKINSVYRPLIYLL